MVSQIVKIQQNSIIAITNHLRLSIQIHMQLLINISIFLAFQQVKLFNTLNTVCMCVYWTVFLDVPHSPPLGLVCNFISRLKKKSIFEPWYKWTLCITFIHTRNDSMMKFFFWLSRCEKKIEFSKWSEKWSLDLIVSLLL